jgi:hypothetical protein
MIDAGCCACAPLFAAAGGAFVLESVQMAFLASLCTVLMVLGAVQVIGKPTLLQAGAIVIEVDPAVRSKPRDINGTELRPEHRSGASAATSNPK